MKTLKTAVVFFALAWVTFGLVYPLAVTAVASVAFPAQASGSLLTDANGHGVGSALIGQPFSDDKYVWGRPSATGGFEYNAMASGGSNLGPTNPVSLDAVKARVAAWRQAGLTGDVPSDLVLASASGLDPDISPESALVQVPRVAKTRGLSEDAVRAHVLASVDTPLPGMLGMPRVNVLKLNLWLDSAKP